MCAGEGVYGRRVAVAACADPGVRWCFTMASITLLSAALEGWKADSSVRCPLTPDP